MNLKNTRLFLKKSIAFLLISLIFPAIILAEEPNDSIVLTGLLTNSENTYEQEILQDIAKTFNANLVLTYDQTNIITGPLEALLTSKNITSSVNGLDEPLLSAISGYQKKAIAHSAGVITAVTLAKQGKLWGEELYLVSPAFTSQDDLRVIWDLRSQGKGFNKIVLYTGDDMIPDFKELHINFGDYTIRAKTAENLEVSLIELVYEDRGQEINVLKEVLKNFATKANEQLGKEPVSVIIYGAETGNRFVIAWEDETIESFYLQNDAQTGNDFQDEEGIKNIPLYEGLPHGLEQLESLAKFYKEHNRMAENNREDIAYFKQYIQKALAEVITAHDPNELLVSPEGSIRPGDRLDYTINYENEGEGVAFGVYITDTLEEGLDDSFLVIKGNGSYDPKTRTLKWFIGELQSKQKGSVSFSINVKQDAQDNSEVINFATVYFPSVPEETRTNGTVNRVTTATDTIAPTTTAMLSPLPNLSDWNNADVDIILTAVDNEGGSGVAKTEYSIDNINWTAYTGPIAITSEGTNIVYYKSSDNLNNIESPKSLEIKIDKTQPTISSQVSPQPNSLGWHTTDVTVSFTATDNLSGIASVAPQVTVSSEGKNQQIGGEAMDLAGNSASTSVTLDIDKTLPEVIITAPLEQEEYILKQPVISSWQTTDSLSGIASAQATVPSGQVIDTSSVGSKLFKVSCLDNAGNKTEKTTVYYVRYSYSGILPPINPDGSSIFKLGKTVPLKFQLKDSLGNFISTAVAKLYLNKISNDVLGIEVEAESSGEANTGNVFRYDSTDNQYIFNLSTAGLSVGTWQIKILLDDGTARYVNIALR